MPRWPFSVASSPLVSYGWPLSGVFQFYMRQPFIRAPPSMQLHSDEGSLFSPEIAATSLKSACSVFPGVIPQHGSARVYKKKESIISDTGWEARIIQEWTTSLDSSSGTLKGHCIEFGAVRIDSAIVLF